MIPCRNCQQPKDEHGANGKCLFGSAAYAPRHDWSVTYPRGSWPLYRCDACGRQCAPSSEELGCDTPPAWFDEECRPPAPLSGDDIEWLLGTGRYHQ